MVNSLMICGVKVCRKVWLTLLLSAAPFAVHAQELSDPTQPPEGIYAGSTTGQGHAAVDKVTSQARKGLQSIIISPGRRAAIINGETVELGEKFGSAKLVEVSEHGVVLQGKRGRQVLALFPDVWLKMKASVPSEYVQKKVKSANKAVEYAEPKESK